MPPIAWWMRCSSSAEPTLRADAGRWLAGLLLAMLAPTADARPQRVVSLAVPNDGRELDRRTARLLDSLSRYPRDQLLRSATALDSGGWHVIAPSVALARNSTFAYGANDGALWAGRGVSGLLRFGATYTRGPLRVVLAPEFVAAENRGWLVFHPAPFFPPRAYKDRSYFSHFWYRLPRSIDAPYRFGDKTIGRLDPGQSSLSLRLGRGHAAELGVSTENHWWGPGSRNALLLSTNAPGFPHLFARTARPLVSRLGAVEARWLLGGLRESPWFDTVSTNQTRAFTAAALVWHAPDASLLSGLSLGAGRAVYSAIDGWSALHRHAFAVWSSTPRSQRVSDLDTLPASGRDQVASVFGRWTFPGAGLEVYGEFGRTELPVSLRDALVFPEHTLGKTLGMQWARRLPARGALSVEGEITNIEQGPSFLSRPIGIWYTSRAVPQGYTNRGEVLGAAIGPSGNSQWVALDYIAPTWRAGLMGQRIRWNNDFIDIHFSNVPVGFTWCHHDVTLAPGIRGAWRPRLAGRSLGSFSGELLFQNRLNYFFQNVDYCPNNLFRRDLRNRALTLNWTL